MDKTRSRFITNLPNNITILRILLVPAFVGCLMYYTPEKPMLLDAAVTVFLVACLTDALDGFVAKRLRLSSDFGSYIDPIADKLLLASGFLSLSFMPNLPPTMRIPAWVTIPVITRDIIIIIGSTLIFLSKGSLKARPLIVGKLTTVAQMATLSLLMFSAPEWLRLTMFILTVAMTVLSGVFYIRMGEKAFSQNGERE